MPLVAAFDIETSSFYEHLEKRACMYHWQMALSRLDSDDVYIITGRTWKEFIEFTDELISLFSLNSRKKLFIGVHNFSYEFQFMRKWFEWQKVFSLDTREPVRALTKNGLEFHCTYHLSGFGLSKLGEVYNLPHRKADDDLDYSLIRHASTPLTDKELSYCYLDVLVLIDYLKLRQKEDGGLNKILLTKTSYVRQALRNACFSTENWHSHRRLMDVMKIDSIEYKMQKRAFMGGSTHASAYSTNLTLRNIQSYDLTSSYPTVMCCEKFPMGECEHFEGIKVKQLKEWMKNFCLVFDVEFVNLKSKFRYERYISWSKVWHHTGNYVLDNGKIDRADNICLTLTELDFQIISKVYKYEKLRIGKVLRWRKTYLPRPIIQEILHFYQQKTFLKGVKDREIEYNWFKEMLNSIYGMMCTDIARPEIIYNDDWEPDPMDKNDRISICVNKYNGDPRRFNYYAWGIYTTAYARRNLWMAILNIGKDYRYSDTDSVKISNPENHKDFFSRYDNWIKNKLIKMTMYYDLDESLLHPSVINKKGEKVDKWLGVWTDEGAYSKFKTLGAKRYMIEKDDKINITVSGVNKKSAVPWLYAEAARLNSDPFELFTNGLIFPECATGKNTHTYLDGEIQGNVVDYLGNVGSFHEKSFIHLEQTSYHLDIKLDYIRFFKGVQENEQSI